MRVCFVFGCVCVWYLTEIIIDKSPKYGGHFSSAPMVICRTVAPLYFCILLGKKKKSLLLCPGQSLAVAARQSKSLLKPDISPL